MKIALLVVDLQKGFLKNYPCFPNLDLTLEYINAAIELFGEKNLPVIVVKDIDAGEEDFPNADELIDGLNLSDAGFEIVEKEYPNSFWKSNLEEVLKSKDIDYVLIAGFAAEHCIYGTHNGAAERGFHPLILKDGITSHNKKYAKMIQNITNPISYFTLEELLS